MACTTLGEGPATFSKRCPNTIIQLDLKTLVKIAELLKVNIRELLVKKLIRPTGDKMYN